MYYFKLFFIPILSLFFLLSCHKQLKENQTPPELQLAEKLKNSVNNLLTNDTASVYDNYVVLNLSQVANKLDRDSSYSIDLYAKFSINGVTLDMGTLSLNDNINILPNSNTLYEYHFTGNSLSTGKALFGSNLQVDVTEPTGQTNLPIAQQNSNILGPRTRTIFIVPKEIFPNTLSLPGTTVNRSSGFPLTWNPDPNNQYGKVQIDVYYYKGISDFNAPNMPPSIASLSYQVPDNGNFNLPSTDLSRFPQGAYIGISIARVWSVTSVNNVAYVAFVRAKTIPLLVIDNSPLTADFSYIFGETSICTALVSGGTAPYTYEWTRSSNQVTWSTVFSSGITAAVSGACPPRVPGVTVYVKLKVTDGTGNTKSIIKPVGYKCLR
jgi:hypothetical protein